MEVEHAATATVVMVNPSSQKKGKKSSYGDIMSRGRKKRGGILSQYYGVLVVLCIILLSILFTSLEKMWNEAGLNFAGKKGERKQSKIKVNVPKAVERAGSALEAGEYERALKLVKRALEKEPKNEKALAIFGEVSREEGVDGVLPALEAFSQCVKLENCSANSKVWFQYASTLACTPDLFAAKQAAFKSLSLKPDASIAFTTASSLCK